MNHLEDILLEISKEVKIQFEKASKEFKTPDDIADNRERIISNFLKKYLPKSYLVGKGEIVDHKGNRSNQIDVIICTPYHPFTVNETERGMFFAEGVACAIEVKSDLSDKKELERGLKQIQSVKKLKRTSGKGDLMFGNEYDKTRIQQVPSVLFGFKGTSLKTLKKNIFEFYKKGNIPVNEQVDLIVILDQGLIYNIKDEKDTMYVVVDEKRILGLVGVLWNENVLLGMLSAFSWLFPKEIRFASILDPYLAGIGEENKIMGKIV